MIHPAKTTAIKIGMFDLKLFQIILEVSLFFPMKLVRKDDSVDVEYSGLFTVFHWVVIINISVITAKILRRVISSS